MILSPIRKFKSLPPDIDDLSVDVSQTVGEVSLPPEISLSPSNIQFPSNSWFPPNTPGTYTQQVTGNKVTNKCGVINFPYSLYSGHYRNSGTPGIIWGHGTGGTCGPLSTLSEEVRLKELIDKLDEL